MQDELTGLEFLCSTPEGKNSAQCQIPESACTLIAKIQVPPLPLRRGYGQNMEMWKFCLGLAVVNWIQIPAAGFLLTQFQLSCVCRLPSEELSVVVLPLSLLRYRNHSGEKFLPAGLLRTYSSAPSYSFMCCVGAAHQSFPSQMRRVIDEGFGCFSS